MQNFASGQILGAMVVFGENTILASLINSEVVRILAISIRIGMAMVLLSMAILSVIRISIFNKPLLKKLIISSIIFIASIGTMWGTNFYLVNNYFNKKINYQANITTPQILGITTSEINTSLPLIHIVKKGESLWMISREYYGNGALWKKIKKDGKSIIIYPGEELEIPNLNIEH